jgi:hypothetical protein
VPRQGLTFDTVRSIGLTLPDVEATSSTRGHGLKLKGRLLACQAVHKSAEPNSLMVRIGPKRRQELLAKNPETYYLTDHYVGYPAMLVRLSRITPRTLKELLTEAWEFVSEGVK